MQFDAEGTILVPVRWYFVPEGTPWLPIPHQFGSTNWEPEGYSPVGIGERWDSLRPWRDGSIDWRIDPPKRFCGKPDWWDLGVPLGTPPLVLSNSGQADCCIDGSGIRVGGESRVEYLEPLAGGTELGATSYVWPIELVAGGFESGGLYTGTLVARELGGAELGAYSLPALLYATHGGIYAGGLYAALLYTNRYGGIFAGGTEQAYLIDAVHGGVYVGGTSVETMLATVHGGVYVGATSHAYLPTLVHGGIHAGGIYSAHLSAYPLGGTKVGGLSSEKLIDTVHGGVKVGGTSVEQLKEITNGGVKVGATSTVYIGGSTTCCGATGTVAGLNFYRILANQGNLWHGKFAKGFSSRPTAVVMYNCGSGTKPAFNLFSCDGTPCSTNWAGATAATGKFYTSPNPTDLNEVIRTDNNPGTAWNAAVWVLWPCNSNFGTANACGTAYPLPYFPGWFMTSGGATQFYSFTPTISDTYTFKTWNNTFTNTLTVFDSTCTTTLATGAGNTGFSVALTAGTQYKLRVAGTTVGVPISISAPSYPSYYLWK